MIKESKYVECEDNSRVYNLRDFKWSKEGNSQGVRRSKRKELEDSCQIIRKKDARVYQRNMTKYGIR